MRRAARTDANQPAIVAALEAIGASVAITSAVGHGFPDLVVGMRGRNWLLELKDGNKAPSRRTLTPDQIEFKAKWRGHWAVVTSAEDAIDVVMSGDRSA
jgi:hypothetical protein